MAHEVGWTCHVTQYIRIEENCYELTWESNGTYVTVGWDGVFVCAAWILRVESNGRRKSLRQKTVRP